MIRDIPTLHEFVLKQYIGKVPTKCMTEKTVSRFMEAVRDPRCFRGHNDIVQEVLDSIIVSGRMTDDACPVSIFRNRTTVNLSNSRISGKYVIRLLEHCGSTLTSLDVSGCFQVSNAVLLEVITQCPHIRHLNVKNCRKLTDACLQQMLQIPALSLVSFNIGGNFNISDAGVRSFIKQNRNMHLMEDFGISGLDIHDETILLLAQRGVGLKALQIAYMDIRESTIQELLSTVGRNLEKLDISWPSTTANAKNVQPSAKFIVDMIASHCANLIELDLTANRNFQLPHVQELIERKLAYQYEPGTGKPLEVLYIRFIATPRASLEENLKYRNLKLYCM